MCMCCVPPTPTPNPPPQHLHPIPLPNTSPPRLPTQGYHLLALWLFVPAMLITPQLLAVGLAAATALFALLEVARLVDLPWLGEAVGKFVSSFTDARDCGRVLISHFSLLLGIAGPIWLTAACIQSTQSTLVNTTTKTTMENVIMQPAWPVNAMVNGQPTPHQTTPPPEYTINALGALWNTVQWPWSTLQISWMGTLWTEGVLVAIKRTMVALPAFAGMLCLGVCDSVACVVGRLFGRRRVHVGARKTVEGMVAGAFAGAVCLLMLLGWGVKVGVLDVGGTVSQFCVVVDVGIAMLLTSYLEAVTLQLDNIALPLHCYAMMCCVVAVLL